ncbi:MAG: hypothetical protein HY228_00720 [Candidatus Yonathbacteria bacterium]|nr:hypothetical protein [Candidatus Yonathbacteria bacterium]
MKCKIVHPVFAKKEVIIGNPQSPIAVGTLWSQVDHFCKNHLDGLMDKIAIVGNIRSVYGIGIVIRNCLANPNIQKLVVSGVATSDGSLLALKRLSTDPSLCETFFLSHRHIERFLQQVEIIYLNPEEVADFVGKEFLSPKKVFKPWVTSLLVPKTKVFPAAESGHLIRATTIKEGYEALLKEIRLFGHLLKEDSEGNIRQELWKLNMVITNQDPLAFDSVPHSEYNASHIKKYCEDFWIGSPPDGVEYRYGHIIRFGFGDQVEAVIKAFKEKVETFRTVISLWDPRVEGGSITAKDPPCITLIHPRIIGENLRLTAYIRTNDMFGGWPLNAMALRYFQYQLLERLKIELKRPELKLGDLEVTSASAHIYSRDWKKIEALLKKVGPQKFSPDPKGNFQIKVEGGEIVVWHFSPDGEKLLQVFRGKNAEELSRKLKPFISDIGNALYVGRELKKAEQSLGPS